MFGYRTWCLAALLASWAAGGAARAADFWVATGGRDRPGGGSRTAPWATIQYAAGRAGAGDVVHVRAGDHAGFVVGWGGTGGGTADRPLTFRAELGARIVSRNARTPDGINIEGAGHVVVEGFRVEGVPRAGIRATGGRGVVIRGNRVDRCGAWGVFASHADDVRIEDNVASRSAKEHGIYVSNSGDRPVVRGNDVWGNRNCGIHMNGDAGQGGDGIISGALVERNRVHDNGATGGSAINADGVQDSTFRNNLLYENHARGISLFRIDGGGPPSGNLVANNTIVQPADANWGVIVKGGGSRNVVVNNVVVSSNPRRGSILVAPDARAGFVSDHNVVTPRMSADDGETILDFARWRSLGYDRAGVEADPAAVFAGPERRDYRPRAGSPAVDAGRAEGAPSEDLDGHPRPSGRAPDAGAFEQ